MRAPDSRLVDEALAIGEEIAPMVRADSLEPLDLAGGIAGIAVFLAQLAAFRDPQERFSKLARGCLERAADELGSADSMSASLFGGLTGVVWAMEHVAHLIDLPSFKPPENYVAAYELVDDYLAQDIDFEFDLVNGLVGIGLWATSIRDEAWRTRIVSRVVALLASSAERTDEGIGWRTPPSRLTSNGSTEPDYNLGVAHGIPGVIGFLAHCVQLGLGGKSSIEMLRGSTAWLRLQVRADESPSAFGYSAGAPGPARLAWCYGDAGVALVLYKAARALRSGELYRFADSVTRRAARRRLEDSGAVDASICHGFAGLAHVFAEIARRRELPAARRARHFWLSSLLELRDPRRGIRGFPYWHNVTGQYGPDPGVLTGAAGVGLVLLAQTSDSLGWDVPFLLT